MVNHQVSGIAFFPKPVDGGQQQIVDNLFVSTRQCYQTGVNINLGQQWPEITGVCGNDHQILAHASLDNAVVRVT